MDAFLPKPPFQTLRDFLVATGYYKSGAENITPEEIDRSFMDKVKKVDGCWLWQSTCNQGQPRFIPQSGNRAVSARRWAWERWRGALGNHPLTVTCGHYKCVNPKHLAKLSRSKKSRSKGQNGKDL